MLLSDIAAQQVLDHVFGLGATGPIETTFYFGLHTTAPNTAGAGGVEVTGTGYAREAKTPDTDFSRTGQIVENDNDIDFGTAGSNWAPAGTPVVAYTVWDASSGGNLVFVKTLVAPRIIMSGDPVKFPAGALQITAT